MRHHRSFHRATYVIAPAVLFLLVTHGGTDAQQSAPTTYRMPPQAIADLVDAPPTPDVDVGPNQQWMLILERVGLPSISELSQPELRIAGLRINPRNNGPSRVRYYYSGLKLRSISDGTEKAFTGLPENPRIQNISWSPDGKHLAFTVTEEDAIELWVADIESGRARRLADARLNDASGGRPYYWLSDNHTLICKLVPEDRGSAPEPPAVPAGPVIQENIGKTAPARTYQDLLSNPYDEALFEYHLTAQLARLTLSGEVASLGKPGLFKQARPSPSGDYILVEAMHRPFSYLVPYYRFPYRVEIWDPQGNVVREIAGLPLAEEVPIDRDAVPTGPREFGWRGDAPATLYWVEALDEGDPRQESDARDRLYVLAAPFRGEPTPWISLDLRFEGIDWGDEDLALVWERWWKDRRVRTWIVEPDDPDAESRLLWDRSYEDRYSDPGRPIRHPNASGYSVILTGEGGTALFLAGEGASPEGNRPFLDELDLETHRKVRLWQSEAPYYESCEEILDLNSRQILTRRESKTDPPNYFRRELAEDNLVQLTDFPHPAPQLADVHRELIQYDREDGVTLSGTLYLPSAYTPEQGPLPLIMWAYPQEFKSADAAAQLNDSPYRFFRFNWGTPLYFLTQGYAVLDGPTMPIVGEGDEQPNDTYVEQLVASAKAAVEEVVRRAVADRDRIAIGGHSYGAFMTANLLAHSDLYRAGIARSGAYNRTLTPFGFQNEERTFWQAPEIYFKMSPFMHVDQINEPILLIHGIADNNSGTFPIQSERLYHALKGHGATARLVMLPHESHGYQARESVMHMYWEMNEWLEQYVKNAPPRPTSE